MSVASIRHVPVMLREVLIALAPRGGGRYIDGTIGGAGHAKAILDASAPDGRILGLDADPDAARRSAEVLAPYGRRASVVCAPFDAMDVEAGRRGFAPCDGIVLDLGLSSDQLADPRRGFSFAADGPLDMRFDPTGEVTAADLVNDLAEAELADLLYTYGEERRSRGIARAIVAARPVRTTGELAAIVARATGTPTARLHPATRTFQALRIAVNDELAALQRVLPAALSLLAPGCRLAVLSFHSLEDRIVKQALRDAARDCVCPPQLPDCRCDHRAIVRLVNRRAQRPSAEEAAANPRARSARLRVAERLPSTFTVGVEP